MSIVTKKLTPKQERFCQEYLVDMIGTQAAIRAGYSSRGAEVQASNLLRNPKVSQRLTELRTEQEKRVEITADAVIKEIASIGFGTPEKDSDKLKALELLGRHLGAFNDKSQVTVDLTLPQQTSEALDKIYGEAS